MPKSEALLRVEELLAAHETSDCHREWWKRGCNGLQSLHDQAKSECLLRPAKTLDRVWGEAGAGERTLGTIAADGPDTRQAASLSQLDCYLVEIAFGVRFEALRPRLRTGYKTFCEKKFGWSITDDTIDDHMNDVRLRLLSGPIRMLRELLEHTTHARLISEVGRGLSGLKQFWHLDRKAKVVSLLTDHGIKSLPQDDFLTTEIWEVLDATKALDSNEKRLLKLKFVDELTIREIAHALSVAYSTASDRVAIATDRFRAVLRQAGIDPAGEGRPRA